MFVTQQDCVEFIKCPICFFLFTSPHSGYILHGDKNTVSAVLDDAAAFIYQF